MHKIKLRHITFDLTFLRTILVAFYAFIFQYTRQILAYPNREIKLTNYQIKIKYAEM